MNITMKLKKEGALKVQKNIIRGEIKSISVEDCYLKKSFLMSLFSNILPTGSVIYHQKKPCFSRGIE